MNIYEVKFWVAMRDCVLNIKAETLTDAIDIGFSWCNDKHPGEKAICVAAKFTLVIDNEN